MKARLTCGRDVLVASLCLLLTLSLFAAPATNSTAKADAKAQIREEGTDEIDLEEIDDAALASKKAAVKATAQNTEYVDISCDEATLADILRQFRKTTRANIICDNSSNLQQRVSAELKHVPWIEALTSILNSRGYMLEEHKGIYYVKEQRELKPILTRPFTLKHASCKDLAELINTTYAPKDRSGKTIDPIANAFESANIVVVKATEPILRNCEAIIDSVDKPVAQVYIEARFLELSNEALHKLGVQWDALESWGASAKSLEASYSLNGTGGKDTDRTWSYNYGFSGTLSADDFHLALSAFESLGEGRIFSNPKVIVSNGKQANVDMTTKYPNIKVTSRRGDTESGKTYVDYSAELDSIKGDKKDLKSGDMGGLFAGSCFFEWGITLSVKPRISPAGLISVEIDPSISQLDTDVTSDGFYKVKGGSSEDADDEAAYGRYPIIKMKRIKTEFTMNNGETAVIGGLSRTEEEEVDTGIPYLHKIPWIGPRLFGWKGRQKVQKEIIVCVTLGIADPASLQKDIGLPTNAVMGREYVNGKKLEPGLREGDADKILLKLDKSSLDGRIDKREREQEAKAFEMPKDLKAGEIRMTVTD